MKIKALAHASFLIIRDDGFRIVTDPYEPGEMHYPAVEESADLVIRSSADDFGHCFAEMIGGNPEVITATDLVDDSLTVAGMTIDAIGVQESLIYKESPIDNAMYCFTIDGLRIGHMGDVGNPLTESQLSGLESVDVLFALTGGPPTLDLKDLDVVIDHVKPSIVIPMHYQLLPDRITMFPVTDFTDRYDSQYVHFHDTAEMEISQKTLPETLSIHVLKSSVLEQPTKTEAPVSSMKPQ